MTTGMKLALGGIGAFVLYEWLKGQGYVFPSFLQSGGSAATGVAPNVNTAAGNAPVEQQAVTPTTIALMLQKSGLNTSVTQTGWQWNYWYAQARGVPIPHSADNPNDAQQMTIGEWYQYVNAKGVNGLGAIFQIPAYAFSGGRGPRGHLASAVSIRGKEQATGWEKARKVRLI